jgi:hypothetical protein
VPRHELDSILSRFLQCRQRTGSGDELTEIEFGC